jgi:hypothetical protein
MPLCLKCLCGPVQIGPMLTLQSIQRFNQLRQKLEAERASLEMQLAAVVNALGSVAAVPSPAPSPTFVPKVRASRRGRRRNAISLRALVVEATSVRPMTKAEILAAVDQRGYQFTAKAPVSSLNAILYGKAPKFRNQDGKYSPMIQGKSPVSAKATPKPPVKRAMSKERRAKLAAAATAYWAKKRAAKSKPTVPSKRNDAPAVAAAKPAR